MPGSSPIVGPGTKFATTFPSGTFKSDQAGAHPGFDQAMALRSWDEKAKDPDAVTAGIDEFVPVLTRVFVSTGATG